MLEKMNSVGLKCVGMVTDGEFIQLRTLRETRPAHVWQLIHNAQHNVQKLGKKNLLDKLVPVKGKQKYFSTPGICSQTAKIHVTKRFAIIFGRPSATVC